MCIRFFLQFQVENDQLTLQKSQLEAKVEKTKAEFESQSGLTKDQLSDKTREIDALESKLTEAGKNISQV